MKRGLPVTCHAVSIALRLKEVAVRLYTIGAAAEVLSLSKSSVVRLITRGELRVIRPTGRAVRITESELARFVAAREAEAATA